MWFVDEAPSIFRPHEVVLFQGDSITDGNRGRSTDPNHILGHGYAFLIAARFGAKYPEDGLSFLNRGVSGNTVVDLANRWQADTLALKPTVISVLVGVNDVYYAMREHRKVDLAKLEATYDSLVASAPGVRFVLGEPFILKVGQVDKDYPQWRAQIDGIGEIVRRLGTKYHAPVVRFQRLFDEAARTGRAEHWIWDGIHPTYSGHQLMADEWVRTYNEFYVSPLIDPARNSAIAPVVNFERDSYDWLHRHADVLEIQRRLDAEIVMVGDSITHFWCGEPASGPRNGPKSWKATIGNYRVLNMGCGWDRTQNVLWRLRHGELQGLRAKTIVLNIGTNNLVGDQTARTNTPEETSVGIQTVVEELRKASPNSRIVVMAIFPRGFEKGNDLDRRISLTNALVAKALAGRPNVEVLNIGDQLREPDGSISKATMADGTHPTERGYEIWANALRRVGVIK